MSAENDFIESVNPVAPKIIGLYLLSEFRDIASYNQRKRRGLAISDGYEDGGMRNLAIDVLRECGYIDLKFRGRRRGRPEGFSYWSALADSFSGAYRAELTEKGLEWSQQLFPELYATENSTVSEPI